MRWCKGLARKKSPLGAGLLALGLGACGWGGNDGALQQASFSSDCSGSSMACVTEGLDAPLAVGAQLTVDVNLHMQGSTPPPLVLQSANPEVLSVSGRTLAANQAGVAALLALTPESEVADFVHVWAEAPTQLVFERRTLSGELVGEPTGPVQLMNGDQLQLSVEPYTGQQRLLGTAQAGWSVDDPQVLQLVDEGLAGKRRLIALKAGNATVTVTMLGLTNSIQWVVLP